MGSKTLQNTKITFNTIAKDLDSFAKVAKFSQIWSH